MSTAPTAMTSVQIGDRDGLPFPSRLGALPPRSCRGDEEKLAFVGETDRGGERAPGDVRGIE